jgi:intron-binding protein aquarius
MVDVILSLVRTKNIGYLREIRRWIVALSRARLGLYVVGRRSLFESCAELEETWTKLVANGDQLELVSGEMWPTQRKV